MSETLLEAAVGLYGRFNNGNGVKRPTFAHEVLADIDYEQYGSAMDGIYSTIQEKYHDTENMPGYKAFNAVNEAARNAVLGSGYSDNQISRVALSEISAEWIVEAKPDPELVQTLTSLVMKSRPVAREFLKLFWWDDALDID